MLPDRCQTSKMACNSRLERCTFGCDGTGVRTSDSLLDAREQRGHLVEIDSRAIGCSKQTTRGEIHISGTNPSSISHVRRGGPSASHTFSGCLSSGLDRSGPVTLTLDQRLQMAKQHSLFHTKPKGASHQASWLNARCHAMQAAVRQPARAMHTLIERQLEYQNWCCS
jgi:hypothetical protein